MKARKLALYSIIATLLLSVVGSLAHADEAVSPYRVDVDIVNQIVTVYENRDGGAVVMQGLCSSGADDATPLGTFTMPDKKREGEREEWFHFRAFGGYARYASRIHYDVMFHSLLYNRPKESAINEQSVKDFGYPVSHGCIRMRTEDARFIAQNCPVGTKVKIHKDSERDEELRDLLYQSSYHASSGRSYSQFLGVPDEPGMLGRGCTGSEVRDLQLKLKALGIYDEAVNEEYTLATVRAVREAQDLLGMAQTGLATLEFQNAITDANAPAAMNVTLGHGSSGPAVRALQKHLQALKLYNGDVDGVYDVDVTEAVTTFQNVYGFEPDGVATPIVQKAVYYESEHVQAMFVDAGDYQMTSHQRELFLGTVKCQVGIKLRQAPSTEAESLMSLKNGTAVIGVEHGDEWSKVMKNGETGYVMNRYMEFTPKATLVLDYSRDGGAPVYTIGITDLNESPAERFTAYVEGGGSLEKHEDLAERAIAEGDLDIQSAPSTSGEVLGALPRGESARVLLHSSEWTYIEYAGLQGYIPTDAATFQLAPADADDMPGTADLVFEDDTTETALASPHEGKAVPVYESADESSKVLGTMKPDTAVNVIETVDGWSLIELQGHRGYVKEIDLKFTAQV